MAVSPEKSPCPSKPVIHRPVVDEYGRLLRRWLRQARVQSAVEPAPRIQKVWLTHDVDAPFYCRTFRNLIRETVRGTGPIQAWKMFNGPLQEDPFYTFPWLLEQRNELKAAIGKGRCESLFFIKSGGSSVYDKPRYKLCSKDLQELLLLCKTEKARIGLHTSYDAGKNPALISTEKELLERQPWETCHLQPASLPGITRTGRYGMAGKGRNNGRFHDGLSGRCRFPPRHFPPGALD